MMNKSRVAISAGLVILIIIAATTGLNVEEFNSITSNLDTLINSNRALIGGFCRLSFHDCVSEQCDGCINLSNNDNRGLAVYINALENFYSTNNLGNVISRADLWALAGRQAVQFGAQLRCRPGRPCTVPNIEFKWGREDCATAPSTNQEWQFPDSNGDTDSVLTYFNNTFNFTAEQTVAILGAHTLGRAHRIASGYDGPWVANTQAFDNRYYRDLLDANKGWAQIQVETPPNPHPVFFSRYQWISEDSPNPFMMLNADMSLIKNLINIDAEGSVEGCTYQTCSASSTAGLATQFANNNNNFLAVFGEAFTLMISHGYNADTELFTVEP